MEQPDLFGNDDLRGLAKFQADGARRSKAAGKAAETRKKHKPHRVTETSSAAWQDAKKKLPVNQIRALAVIPTAAPGMTSDELAKALGLRWQTARPLMTHLKNAGLVIELIVDGKIVKRRGEGGGLMAAYIRVNP